jgi:hypothetical protein
MPVKVTERNGELAAISVYTLVDARRGFGYYQPVGGGEVLCFFNDQIEEVR